MTVVMWVSLCHWTACDSGNVGICVTEQPVTVAMWVSLCHWTACDSGNVGMCH